MSSRAQKGEDSRALAHVRRGKGVGSLFRPNAHEHGNPVGPEKTPDPLPPAIGTVRWPRVVAKDPDCAESLKGRTLTNLYNERPEWLNLAHRKLDEAVFVAYDWDPAISDEELLERLLELNLERSGT